jgi:hypothetical protein
MVRAVAVAIILCDLNNKIKTIKSEFYYILGVLMSMDEFMV